MIKREEKSKQMKKRSKMVANKMSAIVPLIIQWLKLLSLIKFLFSDTIILEGPYLSST